MTRHVYAAAIFSSRGVLSFFYALALADIAFLKRPRGELDLRLVASFMYVPVLGRTKT